ncbi:hypothetical protein B0H11DRAFT_1673407, partial [Mycena galericulata]
VGGGTRAEVFGGQKYGNGYPHGVAGGNLSFYYWPVVWSSGNTSDFYLYNTSEYGAPNDTTRPGGQLFSTMFKSNSSVGTVFRVLTDNTTLTALIHSINSTSGCASKNLTRTNITGVAFDPELAAPKPEQVIAYYRGSSAALSLDGYNNTSVFAVDDDTAEVALPGNIDGALMDCLNSTIRNYILLVEPP